MNDHIYLDYNATTPIDPRVVETMQPYLTTHFGNPSSGHSFGQVTAAAVNHARQQVADLLACQPEEIIFTSGGSEANNLAIKGVVFASRRQGNHIITSAVEHPAVSEICNWLASQGFEIATLPVDEFGIVDPGDVAAAITAETILITIMHANNEVGSIQPITDIAHLAHQNGIPFHTDAAQSVGKIPVPVAELGVDLLSLAGHKIYAPKGIGALYVRDGLNLEKQIHGAGHEHGLRAGTENVPYIVGLGKACEIIGLEGDSAEEHLRGLRDRLVEGLRQHQPQLRVNGHPDRCLPNTASISYPGIEANQIIAGLKSVAASAGAACHAVVTPTEERRQACHADLVDVSKVLRAMEVPEKIAMGTLRLSVGRFSTSAEIDQAVGEISAAVEKLKTSQR